MTDKEVSINKAVTLAKRNLVDSIWKSANIEGLGTTFPKTEAILDNLTVDTNREEVLFIVNMRNAWKFLFEVLNVENKLAMLREFNKICGNSLIYGSGDLRTTNVQITGSTYVSRIPEYVDVVEDISKLNLIEDSIERAVSYFCYIAKSQLFIDGNKRVAQLVCNKILVENGVGILSIDIRRLYEFKMLLVEYYENENNKNKLVEFLKSMIAYVDSLAVNTDITRNFSFTADYEKRVIDLCNSIGIAGSGVIYNILNNLPKEEILELGELKKTILNIILNSD